MLLYQVQLETREKAHSYEIATPDLDAMERALADIRFLVPEGTKVWVGGYACIGDIEVDEPGIIMYVVSRRQVPVEQPPST